MSNQIAEHHRVTNHTTDWVVGQCFTYTMGTLKRLTFESMFINLKPTPLNLRPTSSQHLLKLTKLKDLTLLTDQNQKIRADLQ